LPIQEITKGDSFECALVNVAHNANILKSIIGWYVGAWRKMFGTVDKARKAMPVLKIALGLAGVVANGLDTLLGVPFNDLHSLCQKIIERTCNELLDTVNFRSKGLSTDAVVETFMHFRKILTADPYTQDTDSKEFKKLVDEQLTRSLGKFPEVQHEVVHQVQMG
jgi:hypothetical protein